MLNSRLPKKSTSKSNVFPERWFDPTFAIFCDFHEFFQGFPQLLVFFSRLTFLFTNLNFCFQLLSASPPSPRSPLSQEILVSVLSSNFYLSQQRWSSSLSQASKPTKLGWTAGRQRAGLSLALSQFRSKILTFKFLDNFQQFWRFRTFLGFLESIHEFFKYFFTERRIHRKNHQVNKEDLKTKVILSRKF